MNKDRQPSNQENRFVKWQLVDRKYEIVLCVLKLGLLQFNRAGKRVSNNMKIENRVINLIISLFGILSFLSMPVLTAAESELNFVPAKPIDRPPASYPASQRAKQNAGMVELTFMVDKEGKIFEPYVTAATKQPFEREAIEASLKYLFSSAKLNGEPVEGVQRLRTLFMIEQSKDAVPKKFARIHRYIEKSINSGEFDRNKLETRFESMASSGFLTPYAYAHLNLLKFRYAIAIEDRELQISAIRQMLLFEGYAGRKGKFVDDDLRLQIRRSLFILYVQTKQYAEAMDAYFDLKKIDPDAEKVFGQSVLEILELKNNEAPVSLKKTVGPRGYNSMQLFKNVFSFDKVEGKIDTLKLRCRNKYTELAFSLESEYQIPKSWGYCYLQVIGNEGSNYEILQY